MFEGRKSREQNNDSNKQIEEMQKLMKIKATFWNVAFITSIDDCSKSKFSRCSIKICDLIPKYIIVEDDWTCLKYQVPIVAEVKQKEINIRQRIKIILNIVSPINSI